MSVPVLARHRHDASLIAETPDTLSILEKYVQQLEDLVYVRDSMNSVVTLPDPDAYYYQLLVPGTYYDRPIRNVMSLNDTTIEDDKVRRLKAINYSLAKLYASYPWLVSQTQNQLAESGTIRKDLDKTMGSNDKLAEKVLAVDLGTEMDDSLVVVTRRPNFWKYSGSTSLNITENYASKNWGNYTTFSGLAAFTFNLSYNNQKKLSLTDNFNVRLGFTTDKNDTRRVFKPSTNSMDNTTNAAWKISKYWNYSLQIRMSTLVVANHPSNSDEVISDILSPLNVTIAPGLSTSFKWGKKKKFTGSMNMAPLAYNVVYCQRPSLVTRNGINAGHHSRHSFGPNITVNYNWPICKNVNWSSRVYWYSNLHMSRIEWENNFQFTINKLITASMRIYPRMDDSSPSYKNEHGNYLQFQEYMALGLSRNF